MNAHSCVLGEKWVSLAALFGYGVLEGFSCLEMEGYPSHLERKICIELGCFVFASIEASINCT